jgi:hypothetical protein
MKHRITARKTKDVPMTPTPSNTPATPDPAPTIPAAAVAEIERAVGLVPHPEQLDWLHILLRREVQFGAMSEVSYLTGLVQGIALALGLEVDQVVRGARLEDGALLLSHPPTSNIERQVAKARASGWADNFEMDVWEPGEQQQLEAFEKVVLASRAAGMAVDRLPPMAEPEILRKVEAGTLPDNPTCVSAYRRGWIEAQMVPYDDPPPALEPSPVPTTAPAPRRRIVDVREPAPSPAPTASASRPITAAGGLHQPPWRPVGNPPWGEP